MTDLASIFTHYGIVPVQGRPMLTIGSKRGNTFKYAIGVFEDGLVMHVYDNPFMTTRRTTLYEPIDAEAIRSRRMISRFIDSKSGIIPSPYRAVLKR